MTECQREVKIFIIKNNTRRGNYMIYMNLVNNTTIKTVWSSFTKVIPKHKYTDRYIVAINIWIIQYEVVLYHNKIN